MFRFIYDLKEKSQFYCCVISQSFQFPAWWPLAELQVTNSDVCGDGMLQTSHKSTNG